MTLTYEGQDYFAACLRILEDLGGVETGIIAGPDDRVGTIRLSLPAAFGRRHVMPVLMDLTARHPRLDLAVMFTERTSDIVEEGINLVVRIGTLSNDGDLTTKRLGTQRLLICASPGYIAAHGAPAKAEELKQRDCIISWRRIPRPARLLKNEAGDCVPHEIHVRHEFSNGDAMVQAVLPGGGLCQLPTWLIAQELAVGRLVSVLDHYAGAEMPTHAVWSTCRYLQPKLRAVIDALTQAAHRPGAGFAP